MIDRNEKEKGLIGKAIEGEASAFGLLYDKYQPKIYRFILLKVSRREEAEDLTHQVFLSAWKHVEQFQDKGFPFSSWLFRIARNKVIDYYRTKKTSVPLDEIPEEIAKIAQSDGFDALADKMELERIYLLLQFLTDLQQEIILLRFVEGLSYKEIASITGKNSGAVRVLQHRAIKKLKQLANNKKQ